MGFQECARMSAFDYHHHEIKTYFPPRKLGSHMVSRPPFLSSRGKICPLPLYSASCPYALPSFCLLGQLASAFVPSEVAATNSPWMENPREVGLRIGGIESAPAPSVDRWVVGPVALAAAGRSLKGCDWAGACLRAVAQREPRLPPAWVALPNGPTGRVDQSQGSILSFENISIPNIAFFVPTNALHFGIHLI